ncbi:hypothetical protein [uncultured Bacteroides sp.]|uniref:hypothetical protein n=1 Tax=uncultured Bacteroides sp. TaxID=162156 RepID=UPI002614B31C|nr:hypothetical protein [uncultured Bacteroides sp.]
MVKDNKTQSVSTTEMKKPVCGIVMPISSIDNCSETHWKEVKGIITDAIEAAGFEARLVSEANDSGIIQKRIVQNLYNNDIVVCDVSCKNPNVMFELGMRLAFDKPTIIVMDNMTKYSFDTAPIEHLGYPRDLSYYQILEFKKNLSDKIKGTIAAAKQPNYTTFLKNFGEFQVATIENKKGTIDEVVLSRLDDINRQITDLWSIQRSPIIECKESETETNEINKLTRKLIDLFCTEKQISESVLYEASELDDIRKALFNFIEEQREMRELCGTPHRIRKAILDNLLPF